MAYTSIIPVHRLDNSINYIKDKEKTTKPAASAGSLEEAIDYALNRDKTETMPSTGRKRSLRTNIRL